MTIFERVKAALDTLGVPNAQRRYITTNGTLPDVYITYNLVAGTPAGHYDDTETARNYLVQVSAFKRGGLTGLPNIKAAMTSAGFKIGEERELETDTQSGHYGFAIDFRYYEEILP